MNWKIKAFLQKCIENLPISMNGYFALQKIAGGYRNYSPRAKISQGIELLLALQQAGYNIQGKRTMEIGTGWIPVIPAVFYLFGQNSCHSYDISRLLQPEYSVQVIKRIATDEQIQTASDSLRLHEDRVRLLNNIQTMQQFEELSSFYYHAPADARFTEFPPKSIDIVFSNTTLEHIPVSEMNQLFCEMYRLLANDGIMLHLIDCSDHYFHSDRSIPSIHFLRYSKKDWDKYNNKFIYQNRLRSSQYHRLIQNAGFKIVYWDERIDENAMKLSNSRFLNSEFMEFSPEDICCTRILMVAKK